VVHMHLRTLPSLFYFITPNAVCRCQSRAPPLKQLVGPRTAKECCRRDVGGPHTLPAALRPDPPVSPIVRTLQRIGIPSAFCFHDVDHLFIRYFTSHLSHPHRSDSRARGEEKLQGALHVDLHEVR
jgi:hypothetical protein